MSMSSDDRRDSYRFDLEPGRAVITVGDGARTEVRDLSASGSSLIVRGGAPNGPALLPALVELDGGETFRTHLAVVRVRPQEPGVLELGARWNALDADALQKLSRFLTREHHRKTSDPARLLGGSPSLRITNRMFIANLFGHHTPGHDRALFAIDGATRLRPRLLVQGLLFEDGRRVLRARFVAAGPRLPIGRPLHFVLSGAGAATVFESTCTAQRGRDVLITLPSEVRQTGFRDSARVLLQGSNRAEVVCAHPRLAGERIHGPVIDVAGRGLSFPIDPAEHALFPGDRLTKLQVRLAGGEVEADAVVHSIARRFGHEHVSCGVELREFAAREHAERWHRFVFAQMHPHLVEGAGRAEAAWSVLEASRYLDLWTPGEHREHLRRHFLISWNQPATAVGHALILEKERDPIGVSAGSVAYPGTWILHHLGIRPGAQATEQSPLRHALELIKGILYRLRELAALDHFLIYVERGKRWNERLYGDFAQRYFDEEKLLYTPVHVHRAYTDRPLDPQPHDRIEVVCADPRLWATLAAHLRSAITPLERRAFAFDEHLIDLAAFSRVCTENGYERQREAFFALVNGAPEAALIAETGAEGSNVFGLLNTCRILSLGPSPPDAGMRAALLRVAHAYYRAAERKTFLYLEDDPPPPEEGASRLGLEPIAAGMRWLAHRDVIPPWAAYLDGLLKQSDRDES